MIQMAEGRGSGGGLLSTEQTDLLEEMISEKLSSISNRDFRPYISVIKSWQDDLNVAEKWFSTKIEEYEHYTDTVIEQFTKKEGQKKLGPSEIVEHDHTYCLKPDTSHDTANIICTFVPHNCDFACWKKGVELQDFYNYNPLEVPLRLGWQRVKMNRMNGGGIDVYYIAPCGRRLRSLDEVQLFLDAVGNGISITHFTFDPSCILRTNPVTDTIKSVKVLYYNPDISNGKEKPPVSCVNTHTSAGPDPFEYITHRTHEPDVHIPTNPEFLVCCSCTDNCANRSRCECWQLTFQESSVVGGERKHSVGYVHQRLNRQQHSAIYECNQYCSCSPSCANRVVQNGIQHRLQVFHTGKPGLGWGLRALDDIPKGSFVCSYIGNIYTEQNAEMKAIALGDEYFADLDYIEVIEHHKADYEAEMAELQTDSPSSGSCDEMSDDGSSSLFSIGQFERESGMTTPTEISLLDFDAEMEIVDLDDLLSSSDSEVSLCSPLSVPLASQLSTPTLSRNNSLTFEASTNDVDSHATAIQPPDPVPSANPNPVLVPSTPEHSRFSRQFSPLMRAQAERTRQFFGQNSSFIMDAKTKGNIGRYINHSCAPNMFVQNVFIDTHDLRFPWVAFFAKKRIKAMQELTWNYNYEVGSVEDKEIRCLCGAPQCKGRLL